MALASIDAHPCICLFSVAVIILNLRMGMNKLAVAALFALALAIYGCSTTSIQNTNIITDVSSSAWEAQLSGGTPETTGLNFVTQFTVTNTTGENTQLLDITGFNFINASACFSTLLGTEAETGSSTLNTDSTGEVTGSMQFTITSNGTSGTAAGNTLTLTTGTNGGVSGTSSGSTTTTGTLSHGVVWGTWTLTNTNNSGCTGTGTFIMCQAASSCTIP
jgi:hypothetical protein